MVLLFRHLETAAANKNYRLCSISTIEFGIFNSPSCSKNIKIKI
jgi:hypothetical protein